MALSFNKVEFILSAASEKQFVRDGMPQLAFAGRSNVGKSSVINRLVNRKNFARVGASPGKTSQINYFKIDGKLYLVDLPGYGYAKVSVEVKAKWGKMIENYLKKSPMLKCVFLLVDIRHEPSANDKTMYDWVVYNGYRPIVIATKLDKIKRSQVQKQLKMIREGLNVAEGTPIVPYSAVTKQGRDEIWELIETYAMAPEEALNEDE